MADKDDKAARLAAQLRANLKRRKAQAREATKGDRVSAPADAGARGGEG